MQSQQRHRNSSYRPFPGDEHLVVKFYMDDKKNEKKTREAGYAVYEDVETVSVAIPGDKQTNITAPAHSPVTMLDGTRTTYADRFPEDYERWKKGQGAALVGLPLKQAPFLSKSEVSMLNGQNVFTVEQLAEMGGAPLRSLGQSGRRWQQQALSFLTAARGSRDVTKEAAEKAELMARIEQLENALRLGNGQPVEEQPAPDDERVALKDEIERLTGARPKGNPSAATLERMLAEAKEAA